MTYLRWALGDWYVYRVDEKCKHKHEERIAVWHTDWPKPKVLSFLTVHSCIRGYWDAFMHEVLSDVDELLLIHAFKSFIEDVEKDWITGKYKPTT